MVQTAQRESMTSLFMPQTDADRDVLDDNPTTPPPFPVIMHIGLDHTCCEAEFSRNGGVTFQRCGGGRRVIRRRMRGK